MARPPKTPALPATPDVTPLAELLKGKGLPFEFDGVQFYIRQPTTEEYDDAQTLADMVRASFVNSPDMADMRKLPPSDEMLALAAEMEAQAKTAKGPERQSLARRAQEIRRQSLAHELANQQAALKRDRWLVARLLCDADGNPLCDTTTTDGLAAWEALPLRLKEGARPVVWQMLSAIETLPFGWERPAS